jgi:flavodoxin
MKPIVVYASKSGNTKKIADSIASALNCSAVKVDANPASYPSLEGFDVVFLGCGIFAGTPNEDIVKFVSSLKAGGDKLFLLFLTWGGAPKSDKNALQRLTALLKEKQLQVYGEHFAAYGGWKGILMKRGHPKPEEIQAAANWALMVAQKIGG